MQHSSGIRNLVLLAQGQFVTNLGNQVFDIAMLLWIKQATGSAALMGLAMLFSGLPEALLAPFGGRVADRYGRLRVVVAADIVGAVAIIGVLAVFLAGSDPLVTIAALCVGNAVLGIASAGFGPAVEALVPSLAPEQRLERANAVLRFSQAGGRAVGQGLGGLAFALIGFGGTMAANAVSFGISAWSESCIRVTDRRISHGERDHAAPFLAGTARIIVQLLRVRATRNLLLLIAAFHLCLASLPIVLPYYAEQVLGVAVSWFGVLMATYTVGILGGFALVGILPPATNRARRIAIVALLVAIAFGSLSATSVIAIAMAALVVIGAGIGVIVINLITQLQMVTPDAERATAMGAAQAVGGSALPLGMAATGLILDLVLRLDAPAGTPVRWVIAGAAVLAALAAMSGLRGLTKKC